MTVQIYTRGDCQYCAAARRLLLKRKQPFEEVELTDDLAKDMAERTGQTTTPVIFIDGEFIGGFDELVELDQEGRL